MNMIPLVIACIVALLIFIFAIIQLRKLSHAHRMAKSATSEYVQILTGIKSIDTIAEYCFWQNEVKVFAKNHSGQISSHLFITYNVLLNTALKQRFEKGFSKTLVSDQL